ncbi:MAG: hypothetical protein HQK99_02105 [Nitrospirae bacterium]|nr:hypothetical protein [Nitrospirota bacterium]
MNGYKISDYYAGAGGVWQSGIYSVTYGGGSAGSISIDTRNLSLTNAGIISNSALKGSSGNAGNTMIQVSNSTDISDYYAGAGGVWQSGIYSVTYGGGSAGSIGIVTTDLSLTNTGVISTSALKGSSGNAGNIDIKASGSTNISGYYIGGDTIYQSGIYSVTYGGGSAGSINVDTRNLSLTNAGIISNSAWVGSTGNAGNINIKAADAIEISDYYAGLDGVYPSGIYSLTYGGGNAGGINIETTNLSLANAGMVSTSALKGSSGNAGNIDIMASDSIYISGYYAGSDGVWQSGIYSVIYEKGSAGSINIETKNLRLANAAIISTSTLGGSYGNAGNITVKASDAIDISGYYADADILYSSGIYSVTYGVGSAGSINIETNNLNLSDTGRISTSARPGSSGNGGNITIRAFDSIDISDYFDTGQIVYSSGVYSETYGGGNAGDINVMTNNLSLANAGKISTSADSTTGSAGNIKIKADALLQMSGGDIATSSKYTTGGNIDIIAADVRLYNESGITSNVSKGKDKGGSITISAATLCVLDDSAISADADIGYGGDITINAGTVFMWNLDRALHASSAISGQSGTITIHSPLTDLSGSMVALTPRYLNADRLLPESCQARRRSKGSFVIRGLGNLSPRNSMFSF